LDTGLFVGFFIVALGLFTFAPMAPWQRLPFAGFIVVTLLAYLFGLLIARYQLNGTERTIFFSLTVVIGAITGYIMASLNHGATHAVS
jgi:hypothetical protein